MSLVLVTGGAGFIGGHCILQALAAGHSVRATLRNPARESEVRGLIDRAGAQGLERLSFAAADLERDAGWPEAAAGCDFVLHVASPFPLAVPKHEDDLIVPARDGALRVLKAARAAGVKRVVLTSSFAAVGYGHKEQAAPFNAASWTDPNGPGVSAYAKSKTLAERAAWDYVAKEGGPELSVVNPVGVFGPALGPDLDFDRDRPAPDGRRDARAAAHEVRCGRRAGRRRPASARHDRSAGQGRAFPCGGGRLHELPRNRADLQSPHGRGGPARPDARAARLASAHRRAVRPLDPADSSRTRQVQERDQRQAKKPARLGTALARGRARRDSREPAPSRHAEGKSPCLNRSPFTLGSSALPSLCSFRHLDQVFDGERENG